MKKIIIFIILSVITTKAISNNWDLDKNGINYNQALSENLNFPVEIIKTNIYIYDDFNNVLDNGTTHGDFVNGLMKKISDFSEIREDTPFSQINLDVNLISDSLGSSNIINISHKSDFTSYTGISIYHGFNKHNYIVTTAANENAKNDNPLCFNKDVICVAATNYGAQKTYYSGYGNYVDIAAPGGEKDTERFKILKNLQQILPRLNLVYDGFYLYEEINGIYINIDNTYANKQYNKNAIKLTNSKPALTKLVLAHAINKTQNNDIYTIGDLNGNYNQNLENIPHIDFVNAIKTISNLSNNPEPLYVNGYTADGTSFSAPYVTITLANILEKLSESSELQDISREQVLDLLYMSGDYVKSFDNYDTCQNINKIINTGDINNGVYIQNNNLIGNTPICEAAKIRIPRKINFYQSLYNASFVLPTTIKTTGESDILSNSTSLREFSERNESWGAYRKPNELDVVEINHNLLIDEDLKAKNLTINQDVTVNFNYDIDVSVGNMFDNQGIIEGCFSDTCSHIGSLEFTGKASYFKNEGSVDIDSGSAGIYQGGGELIVKDSCSASLKNPEGEITVLYNENSCQLEAKKITYKPTEFNISRHNINNFNISGEHYKEDSLVVLDKSDSSNFNGYETNYFDVFELFLNDNLTITNKFSTHSLRSLISENKFLNISSIEGYNYDVNQWQLNSLFFDLLNLHSTTINTYQANKIYVDVFYLLNSEINGNPQLFVNSFNNIGSTLNLSHLTIENEEGIEFEFELNNSGTLNISDTLTLNNLGEINASDLLGNNDVINKLHVGEGTHLKIDVDLTVGDLELDDNSSIEILANRTLNVENVTNTNQLNDLDNNSLIYGEGFIGINNFYCSSNAITDFGEVNVSFYNTKLGRSVTSCNVIADKVNFVSFQNNPTKSSAYGSVKIGNDTRNTELYFNSDFNYNAISFEMNNLNSNIYINSDTTVKELKLKNGKIYNDGNLNLAKVFTNIGSFYEGNKINNTHYIVFQGDNILFDKDIEVYRPYFANNPTIQLGGDVIFDTLNQDITIEKYNNIGNPNLTIKGFCAKIINYVDGTVNLENIQLHDKVTGRYTKFPCEVNADTVNLISLDENFDQKDLYGNINNLNIYSESNDDIQIRVVGNLNNYSDFLKITSGSLIDGDLNNYGNIEINSSLTHLNGYLNNNGSLKTTVIYTNVLGNRTGNELDISVTSISGQGEVNTLSSSSIENLSGQATDKIILNHDFTFINPRVYNFEGLNEVNFEGLCTGNYSFIDGVVNLNNIKFNRHSPTSRYNRSHGCEITAGDVNLFSYDITHNNETMLIHGNLNILTSNLEDPYLLLIDNGNLLIDNNSTLNLSGISSIDTELLQINSGSKLFSTSGFKLYDTDVINNGIIEAHYLYSSRIGHFSSDNLESISYILEGNESGEIHVESAVEIDYLRLFNIEDRIILNYPLTVNNTNSTLRFGGSEKLTVKGLCRNELFFENGTIELVDTQLQRHAPTSYYTPSHGCVIEAQDTHLISLDPEYDSRDLFIKGNLTVFNDNSDPFMLNVSQGDLIVKENVNFELNSTVFLDTDLIHIENGARIYSEGSIKTYDSDVINEGFIDGYIFESSRLGHFNTDGLLISNYTLNGDNNGKVFIEGEGKVNNLRIDNKNDIIVMNFPFTFNGTRSTFNF